MERGRVCKLATGVGRCGGAGLPGRGGCASSIVGGGGVGRGRGLAVGGLCPNVWGDAAAKSRQGSRAPLPPFFRREEPAGRAGPAPECRHACGIARLTLTGGHQN
eukprot:scaffold7946_cov116-Isochrysis_galbana.AAC.1